MAVQIERGLATVAMAAAQPEHAISGPESSVADLEVQASPAAA